MHNGTGEAWDVLHLPAIATEKDVLGRDPGDALWPQQYDLAALKAIQMSVGERDFTALYQGTPTLSSGSIFKINTLSIVEAAPKAAQVVRRWDFAATEKKSGKSDPDWTVGVKMQRNVDGGYTVLDVVRLRGKPDEVEKTVLAIASQDGRSVPITVPLDPGQAGVAQAQYYARILSGYKVDAMRESGDKVTRADPFASQVNMGNVALVRAPWNRTYIEELADFPNGSHDDQVDASSGAFEKIGIKKGLPKMPSLMEIVRI
ncbi:phage terminase large subunit [Commensalibacter sp. Nvir]|uniref:phage terminase large subunit n=1 Tax=Commensalibacter sp. Nvir TaxID=3069817 RepID=UPI0030C8C03E